METLHLIDNRARNKIINHELTTQEALINHRFMSLNQVFFDEPKSLERLFKLKKIVTNNYESFSLLQPALKFIDTLKQTIQFVDLLDKYQISFDELPVNNPLNQEKTKLLTLAQLHLDRPFLHNQDQIKERVRDLKLVVHPFYQELYQLNLLNQIDHQTLRSKVNSNQIQHYKKALNPRQEVSGLLKHIKNKPKANINILYTDPNYLHEIKRQFVAYPEIKISFLDETKHETSHLAYYYLLKAIINLDPITLTDFFTLNIFKDEDISDFLHIIHLYQPSFDQLMNGLEPLNHDFETELSHQLKHQKEQYLNALNLSKVYAKRFKLIDNTNIITSVFDLIASSNLSKPSLYSLKQQLEENYKIIDNENVLEVVELICTQQVSVNSSFNPIVVADITYMDGLTYDQTYILGMTQQNFPNFKKLEGLYNEDYVKLIPSFPSLESRIDHHLSQLMNHLQSFKELTLSIPMITYEGKPYQSSFEVEQYVRGIKPTPWDIDESIGGSSIISNITPETARKLFTRDGLIQGSVSSLEIFTKNSFQYFLERGLRLSTTQTFDLDVAAIGTLSHKVLEVLVGKYQKGYIHRTLTEIEEILSPTFNQLVSLYPHRQNHYQLSLKRLSRLLLFNFERLTSYETEAGFSPSTQLLEFKFNNFRLFEDLPLSFNGIIDRIDTNPDGFIVLDYKSSSKALAPSLIRNGQQLQLITYAIVAQRILKQVCLGAYYISLNISLDKKINYTANATKGLILNPDQKPTKPLVGKGFNPLLPDYLYPSKRTQLYSLDILEPYFNTLFEKITMMISNGILTNFVEANEYFYFNDLQRNKESYSLIPELYLEIDKDINFVLEDKS